MSTPSVPDDLAALRGRRVVLGVTGGIAAYKAVEVCRRLVDAGAHVSPVLTDDALRFVGALTFSALASEPARTSLFDAPEPIPHTRLGQQADLVLVAPATAKLIGKYAAGISDDLLTATLLATRAPVLVAPAMHTEMWEHPAVQENLATLRRRGVHVIDPESGRLAGGRRRRRAPGRAGAHRRRRGRGARRDDDLAGMRVLVTAGGTREPIDPVRFIGNRSSGKMGYAVAEAAARRGAAVTLVTTQTRPASDAIDRDPGRDGRGDGRRGPRPLRRRRRRGDGGRGRRLPAQGRHAPRRSRSATACPRSSSSRPPTSSACSVSAAPGSSSSGSPPRPSGCGSTPPRSSRRSAST